MLDSNNKEFYIAIGPGNHMSTQKWENRLQNWLPAKLAIKKLVGRSKLATCMVSMEFYYSSVKKLSLLPLFTLLVCQLISCDLSIGSLVNLYGQFSRRSVLQTIFLFLCWHDAFHSASLAQLQCQNLCNCCQASVIGCGFLLINFQMRFFILHPKNLLWITSGQFR